MPPVSALDELIRTATGKGASALHLIARHDDVMLMLRIGGTLCEHGCLPAMPSGLSECSRAAHLDDRVVVDLRSNDDPEHTLAAIGMPRAMRQRIGIALSGRGGLVLAVALAQADRDALTDAIAGASGDRYTPRLANDRLAIETAARMDCDAILLDRPMDRTVMGQALEVAQGGVRVIAGVDDDGAIAALNRLRALRIDRHLIGGGLRAVVAARPIRRLCPDCRLPVQSRASDSALLGIEPGTVVFQPAGCGSCDGTGFVGPILVFESIVVDSSLRRQLVEGADNSILARHAFLSAPTLAASARTLLREGKVASADVIAMVRDTGKAGAGGTSHPHIVANATDWLDDGGNAPLSARLRGDRSSIG